MNGSPNVDYEDVVDSRIDDIAAGLDEDANNQQPSPQMTGREILKITGFSLISAGFETGGGNSRKTSHAALALQGAPTPSSTVTAGTIVLFPRMRSRYQRFTRRKRSNHGLISAASK